MRAELLVGGSYQGKKGGKGASKGARRQEATPVPRVGFSLFLPLILCGAAFVSLGAWRVNIVQKQRDFEMESARLQQVVLQQRDRTRVLSARLSELQRGENLRVVALESLGMVEPTASQINSLEVGLESLQRWRAAARSASDGFQGREDSP